MVEGDVRIEDHAHIDGQSALAGNHRACGAHLERLPARDRGAFDVAQQTPRPPVSGQRLAWESAAFALGSLFVAVVFFFSVFPTFLLIDWLDVDAISVRPLLDTGTIDATTAFVLRFIKFFALSLPATVVLITATALISTGIRWALPSMKAGTWPVHSNRYLAKWLVNQIQESSLAVLHGIYATVYSATWYRLLGAKVGKDTNSTALGLVPDMLTLGDECFIADAVMLGDEHIDGGWMTVQPTTVSRRKHRQRRLCARRHHHPRKRADRRDERRAAQRTNGQRRRLAGLAPHAAARTRKHAGLPEHLTFHPSRWRKTRGRRGGALRIASPRAGDCRWLRHRARRHAAGRRGPVEPAGAGTWRLPGSSLAWAPFWQWHCSSGCCWGATASATRPWRVRVAFRSGHQHVRRHCRPQLPALPAWHLPGCPWR